MNLFIKKKLLLLLLPLMVCVVILGMNTNAFAVKGVCVNCHTMHNSQGGEPMNFDGSTQPNEVLLKGKGCLGCHANFTMGDPIKIQDANVRVPCVYTNDDGQFLAGGNFHSMDSLGDDSLGHNCSVAGMNNPTDETFTTLGAVPGFDGDWDYADANKHLTCAGSYGCHGRPVVKGDNTGNIGVWEGIKGAHHSNKADAITDPNDDDVGGGYRFLPGIAGYEDPDWQSPSTLSYTKHNEYKGVAKQSTEKDTTTISALCARCHGNFHSGSEVRSGGRPTVGLSGSPWLRHPTDISLPTGGTEYDNYNETVGPYIKYSVVAPVGRTDVSSVSGFVTPSGTTDDIVTCLSCHRAHGTTNSDLLRWNYEDMIAGSNKVGATEQEKGCFICHTNKAVL